MKSPPWSRDELILALDLYFREPAARGSKAHPAVIGLSNILNSLPIHGRDVRDQKFRNANGVGMKLSNFLRYDPSYSGKGLQRGGQLEEKVWREFADDMEKLRRVANAIQEHRKVDYVQVEVPKEDEEDASEGAILTRVHKIREAEQGPYRSQEARSVVEDWAS